jgi:hypothetical protein
MNINIYTYQKQRFAYPVFYTSALSVQQGRMLTVCRRLLIQNQFAPFWNPDQKIQNWDVLGCTGMYWYVVVSTGIC